MSQSLSDIPQRLFLATAPPGLVVQYTMTCETSREAVEQPENSEVRTNSTETHRSHIPVGSELLIVCVSTCRVK